MPILLPTDLTGTAASILVNSDASVGLESHQSDSVKVTYGGFEGDAHSGVTRLSCGRVVAQYPRGTEIRNSRQLTVISVHELHEIATRMGIPEVKPEWIGANIVLDGVHNVTKIPPSSRIIFEGGVSLVVDMENGPCIHPGKVIERFHPGIGAAFVKAALGRRGVTAWVERDGNLRKGESFQVHSPSA